MLQHVDPIRLERGFLPYPDPLVRLSAAASPIPAPVIDHIEGIAAEMPGLLANHPQQMRAALDDLPVYDFAAVRDGHVVERLFHLYSYFANAYVFATPGDPARRIPPGVAVPLYQIAHMVERPPIFSYAALVLYNWRRLDPDGPLELENLAALQQFAETPDERWFGLVHVGVEARAPRALRGIVEAIDAAEADDLRRLEAALVAIGAGIGAMLKAFHRVTEGCDPDVYHRRVRPYMFGFNDVIFEGVSAYRGSPQTLTGGSGAQSSTVPAFIGVLGIEHQATGLIKHLDVMKQHMPKAHRAFIERVTTPTVRGCVLAHRDDGALKDAYNHALQQLITFRKAHFHYAKIYIFDKTDNPYGTGGTRFMEWLGQLVEETGSHRV